MVDSEGVRFLLTTGDNIYARVRVLRRRDRRHRRRRRRLVLHLLPAVSLRASTASPCIRRSAITTPMKRRSATIARRSRTTSTCTSASSREEAAGRASFGPGLFYRFRYGSDIEFVCIDTSKEDFFSGDAPVRVPEALGVRRAIVSRRGPAPDLADSVRAPSRLQRRPAASQHARACSACCRCSSDRTCT